MHFLLHGSGMQTWEYSPVYALRSYAYLMPYTLPSLVCQLFTPSKIAAFYATRAAAGLVCACCEARFYRAVCSAFGQQIGVLTLVFLVGSAGMFHASTAFLPSTTAMYLCMVGCVPIPRPRPPAVHVHAAGVVAARARARIWLVRVACANAACCRPLT